MHGTLRVKKDESNVIVNILNKRKNEIRLLTFFELIQVVSSLKVSQSIIVSLYY